MATLVSLFLGHEVLGTEFGVKLPALAREEPSFKRAEMQGIRGRTRDSGFDKDVEDPSSSKQTLPRSRTAQAEMGA